MKPPGYREIADTLRNEMRADWRAGQKLPAYLEIAKRFQSTPVTVQRAMDLLADQGFIETRPTVGSFVADRPPSTCQVGLVFPGHPEAVIRRGWSRNYLANLTVAEQLNAQDGPWQVRYYMDVSEEGGRRGLRRLRRDLEAGALAGLIWSYSPHDLLADPIIQHPTVPMVHYNPAFCDEAPGLRIHNVPGSPFASRGATWARDEGITDVAMLVRLDEDPESIAKAFTRNGLQMRPEWIIPVDPYSSGWVSHAIAALFADDGREHPEALVVTDDHLVEPTVTALLAAPPPNLESLRILAHWNFPLAYSGRLPIVLHGYDADRWMHAALDQIGRCPLAADMPTTAAKTVRQRFESIDATSRAGHDTTDAILATAREILQCSVT